jgi:hypothetical protein
VTLRPDATAKAKSASESAPPETAQVTVEPATGKFARERRSTMSGECCHV